MKKLVLPLFLLPTLASCLPVPVVPHYQDRYPSRENLDQPLKEGFPEAGRDTREDVLSRLGAPDEVSAGGARVAYRWRKVTGELLLWNSSVPIVSSYRLTIDFDASGRVIGREQK